MSKIIRVGLLAYGMSGKIFHAPFLNAHHGFELRAVVERNTKKAKEDYPTITSYHSVEELLNDDQIDLVVVNTPSNLHFEHIKWALEKGKHVLSEKPFTATVAQAQVLFKLADTLGKKILFYQNRRWNSDYISVKKVIESGVLGKMVEVHLRLDRYRNVIGPKAFKETVTEASGLMYDLGPHLIDQAIDLFGIPLRYHKVLGKNRVDTVVDDYFSITLEYPNSVYVFVTGSMLVVNPQAAYVVHGTKGSFIKHKTDTQEDQLLAGKKYGSTDFGIEQENAEGVLSLINAKGKVEQSLVPSEKGDYIGFFEAAYQTIIHEAVFPISREEVISQLEILEN